ncbi:UNVERIFIED_CONTAM: hypothetical protein B566_EDAN019354 [Ephemera danica]|nr:hypothetical protein B566_EDAN019354 [Ephemera danica]
MVLISKDELEKLKRGCSCKSSVPKDESEKELDNVLENATLSDREKWLKYGQLFDRFQQKLHQKRQRNSAPIKVEIASKDGNDDVTRPGQATIVEELPIFMRDNIRRVLKHLKKSDITWNDLGEVFIRDNKLENSSIKELILDLVDGGTNTGDPIGWKEFYAELYRTNVPIDLITRASRKSFISTLDVVKKTSKRVPKKKNDLRFISQFATSPQVRKSQRKQQELKGKTLTTPKENRLLSRYYYDPRYPESYAGARRLRERGRREGVSQKVIESWLTGQETYTRHKPVVRKFQRRFYYASRDNELWQCDLCDMRSLSTENNGFNYLLTCIDIFSKYANVRPLLNKKPTTVINALQNIFETGRKTKPLKLNTDKGSEFTANSVQQFLKKQNVQFYTTQDPTVKAAVVERFNRTLKDRMWRYFTHKNTQRYIDQLQNLVDSYNSAYHKSIRMAPAQVNEKNLYQVWTNLYGNKRLTSKKKPLYSKGDYVLVAKEKGTFSKGNSSMRFFPDNTTACYTTQLEKRVELEGEWEVSVVEVMYPNTVQNMREGNNYVKVLHKIKRDSDDNKIILNTRHFDSINSLVMDMNRNEELVKIGLRLDHLRASDRIRVASLYDDVLHVAPSPTLTMQLGKVLPFLTRGAKAVGKETARAGLHILDDISRDIPVKEAFKARFGDARDNLKRKAEEKLENIMSGSGYKSKRRKKRVQSGSRRTRVNKSVRKRKRAVGTKKRRVKRRSSICTKSELDLFALPPTQTSIESGHYEIIKPLNAITDETNAIEFIIPGHTGQYLDLSHTELHAKLQIVKAGGLDLAATDNVAPVNYILHTMFSSVEVYLNNKLITPVNNTAGYRAYIEMLLNYSSDVKANQMTAKIVHMDTQDVFDTCGDANAGYKKRKAMFTLSKEVDAIGYMHSDLFNQDRFLLSGVDVRIKFIRGRDTFCLMSDTLASGKLKINDLSLHVRRVELNPSVALAHAEALRLSTARYPITRVDVKVLTIPSGVQSKSLDTIYTGQLPKRVTLGFVENKAFNGN